MRANIGKALRTQFEAELKKEFSGFERLNVRLAGATGFAVSVSPDMSLYVLLQTVGSDDRFNISVGWGKAGGLPEHLPLAERDTAVKTPGMVRLRLLGTRPFYDIWWTPDPSDVGYGRTVEQALVPRSPEDQCVDPLCQ